MARRTRDGIKDRDPEGRDEGTASVDFDAPTLRMRGDLMEMDFDEDADTDPALTAGPFEPPLGYAAGPEVPPDSSAFVDQGLSIEPEDLGMHFLRDATEQDNLESEFNPEAIDPGLLPGATLTGRTALDPPTYVARSGAFPTGRSPQSYGEAGELDMRSNVIREGSLFDRRDEEGETRSPRVSADDMESRGHAPAPPARGRAPKRARIRSGEVSRRH